MMHQFGLLDPATPHVNGYRLTEPIIMMPGHSQASAGLAQAVLAPAGFSGPHLFPFTERTEQCGGDDHRTTTQCEVKVKSR